MRGLSQYHSQYQRRAAVKAATDPSITARHVNDRVVTNLVVLMQISYPFRKSLNTVHDVKCLTYVDRQRLFVASALTSLFGEEATSRFRV